MTRSSIQHVVVATVVALAVTALGGASRAQPRDNPIERARQHMELGQEAFAGGDFSAAREQFVNAYSASPFPAFLYNAGLAAEKGGENQQAAELYRRYLDDEPGAVDAAEVEMKIRNLLAEAPTETIEGETQPGIAAPTAEVEMKSLISVRTNPPDAKIRILDEAGTEIASFEGPSGQTVIRGTYTVEASHPDYRTVQTDIHVVPGQVIIVVVEMSQGAFLGFVHLKTDIPGAAVFIDDKAQGQVGTTPWGNVLPTGIHTIWVEKPGYVPITQEVEVNVGDKQQLSFELERLTFGTLLVKSNVPGAKVYLNEQLFGVAPLEKEHTPGRHRLKVTAEGMKDYDEEIVIARGQRTKLLVRMNPTPSRTSAWVSLGFAVALFAGGGVSGGMALKLDNELESERNRGRLADDDPRILHGFLWALGADIAFGVGTIVGALCIYYFLRDPLPPSEGKQYDPVDLEENPEDLGVDEGFGEAGADAPAESEPAETTARLNRPRVLVAPLVTAESAGFGLAVAF